MSNVPCQLVGDMPDSGVMGFSWVSPDPANVHVILSFAGVLKAENVYQIQIDTGNVPTVILDPSKFPKLDQFFAQGVGLITPPVFPDSVTVVDIDSNVGMVTFRNLPASLIQLYLGGCSSLTSLPSIPQRANYMDISGCALSAAAINAILAQLVARTNGVVGSIDMSGGTSAAPSGQGITDKNTLVSRGWTITTN